MHLTMLIGILVVSWPDLEKAKQGDVDFENSQAELGSGLVSYTSITTSGNKDIIADMESLTCQSRAESYKNVMWQLVVVHIFCFSVNV